MTNNEILQNFKSEPKHFSFSYSFKAAQNCPLDLQASIRSDYKFLAAPQLSKFAKTAGWV
jgi:hypothetical protein